MVRLISWSAAAFEGSIAWAFWNSVSAELQIALLQGLLALLQVELAVRVAHVHGAQLVFGVGGIGPQGALVVDQSGVVVLMASALRPAL